jgi:glycosyltransferase involved in cell wall biosynthesis
MKKPLVSVVMITYGHENFIKQAIEGVLMQECDFEVEIIIANDCSKDDTDEVIKEIIKNDPKSTWIKYVKHEKNIGMMPNFIFALKEAQGKYIALCEGDDYWTDPLKLQKQVGFLDAHPDFVMVAHRVDELYEGKILSADWRWNKKSVDYTLVDYLYQLFFHTSSVVYKNIDLPTYINTQEILQGDIAVFTYVLSKGKMHYFEEIMSVYRKHIGGVSNSLQHKDYLKNMISKVYIYNNLNKITDWKYNKFIKCNIAIENQIYLMYTTSHFTYYRCKYWLLKIKYKILLILFKKC